MTTVTVEYMGVIADTDGTNWACKNTVIQKHLNTISNRDKIEDYCPDYAFGLVALIKKEHPGLKILKVTDKNESKKGVIY